MCPTERRTTSAGMRHARMGRGEAAGSTVSAQAATGGTGTGKVECTATGGTTTGCHGRLAGASSVYFTALSSCFACINTVSTLHTTPAYSVVLADSRTFVIARKLRHA